MDSEFKYLIFFITVFIVCTFSAIGVSEYSKYTCKQELAKTSRPVAEVELLCK